MVHFKGRKISGFLTRATVLTRNYTIILTHFAVLTELFQLWIGMVECCDSKILLRFLCTRSLSKDCSLRQTCRCFGHLIFIDWSKIIWGLFYENSQTNLGILSWTRLWLGQPTVSYMHQHVRKYVVLVHACWRRTAPSSVSELQSCRN